MASKQQRETELGTEGGNSPRAYARPIGTEATQPTVSRARTTTNHRLRRSFDPGITNSEMSKAFTKETDGDEDELDGGVETSIPSGFKNYITPAGVRRLNDEVTRLWKGERPKLVETIAWAASNGDRSENGDYIYGKRKLREIDRRIRFLSQRIDSAVVVDNAGKDHERVYFGATVTFVDESGSERTVSIVGVDEVDAGHGRVSWVSPIATAMLKGEVGDVVTLRTPRGAEEIEIIGIRYDPLP